jgi:Ser-tRNA(Ala) deacylase AlaX
VLHCTEKNGVFETVLSKTILYPEGGGQPSDHGSLDGMPVLNLHRREDGEVIHVLDRPVDGTVSIELDWKRRLDHMQQHTAQHLLTAVAAALLGFETTAFHLGADRSDIELDCPGLTGRQRLEIEDSVNAHIGSSLPVTARFVDASRLAELGARTRGLPEDISGPVRLIEIEGVDASTCGGTHVASTSELLAVKLLNTERLRGGTRLFFVAGRRAMRLMETSWQREQAMNQLLSCGPEHHESAVAGLLNQVKILEKNRRRLQLDLAAFIGRDLARQEDIASVHLPGGDMDALKTVAAVAREHRPDVAALLTAGGDQGVFLLVGPPGLVESAGPAVARALAGRGGGASGSFQGKYTRLNSTVEALALLRSSLGPAEGSGDDRSTT